jgi:hypothetical protein
MLARSTFSGYLEDENKANCIRNQSPMNIEQKDTLLATRLSCTNEVVDWVLSQFPGFRRIHD